MGCMRLVRRRIFGVGLGMAEVRLLERVFLAVKWVSWPWRDQFR